MASARAGSSATTMFQPRNGGMLSAVLEHYARYQTKKAKKTGIGSGEDSCSTNLQEVDSIYRSSINGRYMMIFILQCLL